MFESSIRPIQARDVEKLEQWRKSFTDGVLTVNHGYVKDGLETVVALDGKRELLGSLTGMLVLALDPLIRDPQADHGDVLLSLFAMCRHLECNGVKAGALESMIAVPNALPKYKKIVEKCGFIETAPDCTIYRRVLG